MFFRSVTLFRMAPAVAAAFDCPASGPDELQAALAAQQLKPIEKMVRECYGFVPPLSFEDDPQYTHRVGRTCWFTLGAEKKLLTAAALAREVQQRMQKAQERLGLKISGKQARAFKDEALVEMLPKAFVQPERCDAYVDLDRRLLVIDHASRKVAEGIVSHVRNAIGTFPALPINAEVAPRSILTGWLAGEPMPEGLTLGEECELRDGSTDGARVKFTNAELRSDEIAKHLEAGMQCVRLGLVLDDHVRFVLGEDLVLRKVKFLDGALEGLEDAEHDSVRQEMDARFALMTGELGRLFDVLEHALKLSPLHDAPTSDAEPPASKQQRAPRKAKAPKLPEGISSVTVTSVVGGTCSSATFTAEQFNNLGTTMEQYYLAIAEVRSEGLTSEAHLCRVLGVGPKVAAGLLKAMQAVGVITAPNSDGIHHLVNGELELGVDVEPDDDDPLYSQAVAHVRITDKASIASVQRVLKIGYNRAARLVESMEARGVVSPPSANGDRKVL